MLEAQFLGGLLPSHPDYEPIIEAIRTKYNLPELYPLDEPIKNIYLGDEIVTLAQFTQDVKNHILESMDNLFPEDYVKKYKASKKAIEMDYQKELEKFDGELKPVMEMFFEFTKNASRTVYQILDANIDEMVMMLSNHLILGDTTEAPQDWFGKVISSNEGDDSIIYAFINKLTNLDLMFEQIRKLHKKTFGVNTYKINKPKADTAYYLQLKLRDKGNDFILDEYIRLNKISLPRDKNSARYFEVRNKAWQKLKKRLKTAKAIIEAIGREKN